MDEDLEARHGGRIRRAAEAALSPELAAVAQVLHVPHEPRVVGVDEPGEVRRGERAPARLVLGHHPHRRVESGREPLGLPPQRLGRREGVGGVERAVVVDSQRMTQAHDLAQDAEARAPERVVVRVGPDQVRGGDAELGLEPRERQRVLERVIHVVTQHDEPLGRGVGAGAVERDEGPGRGGGAQRLPVMTVREAAAAQRSNAPDTTLRVTKWPAESKCRRKACRKASSWEAL